LLALSHRHGFATAAPEAVLAVAAAVLPFVWVCLWPVALRLAPTTTATEHRAPSPSVRAVLRDGKFWSLAAPFAMALAAQVGLLLYQVSYLLPVLGTAGTSIALMSTSVASVAGRLGLGLVIDNIPRRATSATVFAVQAGRSGLCLRCQTIQRPFT
jgi:hypothetical protein